MWMLFCEDFFADCLEEFQDSNTWGFCDNDRVTVSFFDIVVYGGCVVGVFLFCSIRAHSSRHPPAKALPLS